MNADKSKLNDLRSFRGFKRLLRGALIAYLLVCVMLYFAQDWLLFPGASYQGSAETTIVAPPGCEMVRLNAATGDRVTALWGQAIGADGKVDPQFEQRPTLLYFYGNGATIAWSMGEFKQFRKLDVNVLLPDYVGYGMSTGKPSETSLYATADAAYEYLTKTRGVPPRRIVAIGWSLGAAVAIDLASRKPVAACAMFCPFTNLRETAHYHLPWFPTSLILKYRFDNLAKIGGLTCPLFICNGLKDEIVPPPMSDRLAAAAKAPVTRVKVPTADHNGIFSADPDAVFPALAKFLNSIHESTAEKRR